jgi:anthranilate phosphoribosyltransferase
MVVHGADHLDELSTTGPTAVLELTEGDGDPGAPLSSRLRRLTIDGADLGLARVRLEDLRGADPATNAAVVGRVLGGERGAYRDIVVLNAAAALVVAGLAEDFTGGVQRAAAAIDDGRAASVLDRLRRVSQECAESS